MSKTFFRNRQKRIHNRLFHGNSNAKSESFSVKEKLVHLITFLFSFTSSCIFITWNKFLPVVWYIGIYVWKYSDCWGPFALGNNVYVVRNVLHWWKCIILPLSPSRSMQPISGDKESHCRRHCCHVRMVPLYQMSKGIYISFPTIFIFT